jgi:putative DNA primase/helicase
VSFSPPIKCKVITMKEYKISENPSTITSDDYSCIPSELKERNQRVRYRIEDRQGKLTKVPLNPRTGQRASSTDPSTWGTYEEAVNSRIGNGIGFVFTLNTGIVGIDLDHVLYDGKIEPWAEEIVRKCNSYTEISPSGEGLHIYVYGELPPDGRKNGQFECYGKGRYSTVTGNHLPGTRLTVEHRQEDLLSIHAQIFGHGNNEYENNDTSLSDAEIIKKASNALNGEKFSRLWQGNWNEYPSQSEADAALCGILAFYLGQDPARIDSFFRQSGLIRPKWDEKHYSDGSTYGHKTISRVLERNSNGTVSNHPDSPRLLPSINVSSDDLKTISGHAWDALRGTR